MCVYVCILGMSIGKVLFKKIEWLWHSVTSLSQFAATRAENRMFVMFALIGSVVII